MPSSAVDPTSVSPAPDEVISLDDPVALRAYAHPIRLKLVSLLRRNGPLTATEAADLLGESTGTTSFHLRQLAKYGLAEEAGGGTGRRKPWRATARFTTLPGVVDAESAGPATAVRSTLATHNHHNLLDWIARAPSETAPWQRAAEMSDLNLYCTAAELQELTEQVQALLTPFVDRAVHPEDRPDGARLVTYLNIAYPTEAPR